MRHVILGGCILCCAIGLAWLSPVRTAPQQITEIPQPEGWVPFDADVMKEAQGSTQKIVGRYFRDSDGSTRLESWDPSDPTVRVISISSIPRARAYVYSPRIGWESYPMVLPPGGYRPLRHRLETKNLSRRPEEFAGFEVYEYVGAVGDISYRAPGLNFFPLFLQTGKDGQRTTYSNVQIREQDPALFDLPPGVSVTEKSTPRGIVLEQRSDSEGQDSARPTCPTCPGQK